VLFEAKLRQEALINDAWIETTKAEVSAEVTAAFAFAEASPFPVPAAAYSDLYSPEVTTCLP